MTKGFFCKEAVILGICRVIRGPHPAICAFLLLSTIAPGQFAIAQTDSNNPTNSFVAVKERALQGDADAQAALGEMYVQGEVTPLDYGKAREWYLKAAQQGLGVSTKYTRCFVWERFRWSG